jgi:hypothetical protein
MALRTYFSRNLRHQCASALRLLFRSLAHTAWNDDRSYCSIAATARLINANHPIRALSTHAYFYLLEFGPVDRDLVGRRGSNCRGRRLDGSQQHCDARVRADRQGGDHRRRGSRYARRAEIRHHGSSARRIGRVSFSAGRRRSHRGDRMVVVGQTGPQTRLGFGPRVSGLTFRRISSCISKSGAQS